MNAIEGSVSLHPYFKVHAGQLPAVKVLLREFVAVKGIRNLNEDPGAVAAQRIGTDGAAMVEVVQDQQGLLHDRMACAALDVGNEANAASIVFEATRIQTLRFGVVKG